MSSHGSQPIINLTDNYDLPQSISNLLNPIIVKPEKNLLPHDAAHAKLMSAVEETKTEIAVTNFFWCYISFLHYRKVSPFTGIQHFIAKYNLKVH